MVPIKKRFLIECCSKLFFLKLFLKLFLKFFLKCFLKFLGC